MVATPTRRSALEHSAPDCVDEDASKCYPQRRYPPIEDHALIGNLRTAALVSTDGVIDSLCWPHFDSPSICARILDADKGGHFGVQPTLLMTSKQQYLPNSNVVSTKFLSESGVVTLSDYMPRPSGGRSELLPWVVRRVEGVRGLARMRMECLLAFDYARAPHTVEVTPSKGNSVAWRAVFRSEKLRMELVAVIESDDTASDPSIELQVDREKELYPKALGSAVFAEFDLAEGQAITFVLREVADVNHCELPALSPPLLRDVLQETITYWTNWIHRAKYNGRWREFVHRCAFTLKLLVFEPTGAVVAAPTFSLPEAIGGARNWDYRYFWVRDSSFVIYAFIRLGFREEAIAFSRFMQDRMAERKPGEGLQIMYSIHGKGDLDELELDHLEGYRGSKPVRIGNGASTHLQNDVYGELLDSLYLYQKYANPCSFDLWVQIRSLVDYVTTIYDQPDMSIWEVRSRKQHYVYSKVMCWVAIDRGLRLADKRSFPLPQRAKWLERRDALYEEIMERGWNAEAGFFCQSYEGKDVLDSALLIMPLVFFCAPNDPRFLSTLRHILKSPDKGGLTANSLVFRYDFNKAEDGVGGEEGTFGMCTLWAIEALARAGAHEPGMLRQARNMFESFLAYGNHVMLFSEELGLGGSSVGNFPQGFTCVSAISAAYNLDKLSSAARPLLSTPLDR